MDKKENNKNRTVLNRREFLRAGGVGTALGLLTFPSICQSVTTKTVDKGIKNKIGKSRNKFPLEISSNYQPPRSWDQVHAQAFFGRALQAAGFKADKDVMKLGDKFREGHTDKSIKGFDKVSEALSNGAWALSSQTVGSSVLGINDFGLFSWEQEADNESSETSRNNFNSKKEASEIIKRAARLYGADLVGIAQQDSKWDYSQFINPVSPAARKMFPSKDDFENEKTKNWSPEHFVHGWEKFPFVSKSVIVLAFEMDYEAISASSTQVSAAAVGEGYSRMAKTAYQLSVFIKALGYNAVAAGNDLGLSVPYAIAAGLGESSRMGQLITYKFGPRIRIAKVYTDFDFVEYDKPKTFGVMDFCKHCKRCADACPGQAIPHDKNPSFEPAEKNAWYNTSGVKKYYVNAKKCFKVWADTGTDCTICIASCPYNKPDFWHHRLVDSITAAMPGAVHDLMREMDEIFGYGNVNDESAVDKFFSPSDRSYDGF